MSFDEWYLAMVDVVAMKSSDPSTKVGCVIVGPTNEVRSVGYNGYPRGVNYKGLDREDKLLRTAHAEENAIFNAARSGICLYGSTLYAAWAPCAHCSIAIIQAGIKKVVLRSIVVPERWFKSCQAGFGMMNQAGVQVFNNDEYIVGYECQQA